MNLDTSRNICKKSLNTAEPGACHGDDLGYLFEYEIDPESPRTPIVPGSIEEKAVHRYLRLWGNFIKCGNPTPDPNEFGLTWEPATKDTLCYLDFDKEISMKTDPDEDRIKVWREIYKSHERTRKFMK